MLILAIMMGCAVGCTYHRDVDVKGQAIEVALNITSPTSLFGELVLGTSEPYALDLVILGPDFLLVLAT